VRVGGRLCGRRRGRLLELLGGGLRLRLLGGVHRFREGYGRLHVAPRRSSRSFGGGVVLHFEFASLTTTSAEVAGSDANACRLERELKEFYKSRKSFIL
jgi:hypothetical protein